MHVLIAIYSPQQTWNIPGGQVDRLRRLFPHVSFVSAPDPATALREMADAEVAFASEIRPAMLAAAPRLRWIHSPAAGVGGMLFPEMVKSAVEISNSRGIHARPIAEHVIGVTLALFRRLHLAMRRQSERHWAHDELAGSSPVRLLAGSTVGVVGLGAIGSAVAAAASALGARVTGIRRRPARPIPPGVRAVHAPDDLPGFLAGADVVVLATPLTRETRGLISRRELQMMKPGAVLINVGRGRLIREAHLIAELQRGTLGGAALDVFEHEPLDRASPLWTLPNVIVTPHVSGLRHDYWDATVDLFADNLRRYEKGEPLLNLVDKQAGY